MVPVFYEFFEFQVVKAINKKNKKNHPAITMKGSYSIWQTLLLTGCSSAEPASSSGLHSYFTNNFLQSYQPFMTSLP